MCRPGVVGLKIVWASSPGGQAALLPQAQEDRGSNDHDDHAETHCGGDVHDPREEHFRPDESEHDSQPGKQGCRGKLPIAPGHKPRAVVVLAYRHDLAQASQYGAVLRIGAHTATRHPQRCGNQECPENVTGPS